MKKFLPLIILFITTNVFASNEKLEVINHNIENALAPFQNAQTQASIKINTLDISDNRLNMIRINSQHRKISDNNIFNFVINGLQFDQTDIDKPIVKFASSLDFDFTKALSPMQINIFVNGAEDILQEYIAEHTDEMYGDATKVQVVVTHKKRNNSGSYTGLSGIISLRVDLDKLPKEIPVEEVAITEATLHITIDAEKGIKLDGFGLINPKYDQLNDHQAGILEVIDKIAENDEEALGVIQLLVMAVDKAAEKAISMTPHYFEALKFIK